MLPIRKLRPDEIQDQIDAFAELPRDTVDGGASFGFLPPLSAAAARTYWKSLLPSIATCATILLAAHEGDRVLGAVQLVLAVRANGTHRAEVAKLMVHTGVRRRGIGRGLMEAAEVEALIQRRSISDTSLRPQDVARNRNSSHSPPKCGRVRQAEHYRRGATHRAGYYAWSYQRRLRSRCATVRRLRHSRRNS